MMAALLMPPVPQDLPAIELPKLVASDGEAFESFGRASAANLDGSTFAIGSKNDDDGGSGAGAVYVYTRNLSTGVITQQAKLFKNIAGLNVGATVCMSDDGNTLLAGTNGSTNNVYCWKRVGGVWSELTVPTPSVTGGEYGIAVAMNAAGSRFAVTAPEQNNGGATQGGATFIFTRSGDTITQQARLLHTAAADFDFVGKSVGMSGDGNYVIPLSNNSSNANFLGIVFFWNGSSWGQQQVLGNTLAPGRNVICIDQTATYAFVTDSQYLGGGLAGRVIVYKRSGVNWVSVTTLTVPQRDLYLPEDKQISCARDGTLLTFATRDAEANIDYRPSLWRKKTGEVWGFHGSLRGADQADGDKAVNNALAGDGKTLLACAFNADVGANTSQGAAWLFTTGDNLGG